MIGNAEAVGTMCRFQITVRRIVVADEASTVRPDGNRRELTDVVSALNGSGGRRLTIHICAVSDS